MTSDNSIFQLPLTRFLDAKGPLSASNDDHIVLLKEYFTKNPEANVNPSTGPTPLYTAVITNRPSCCSLLLQRGAKVENAYGSVGFGFGSSKNPTPLMHATALDVVKILVEEGHASVNAEDQNEWSPLFHAAAHDRAGICSYLIKKGAKVNKSSIQGQTPLMHAAWQGHLETVQVLCREGKADLSLLDGSGNSAMDLAKMGGRDKVVAMLEGGLCK